MDNLEQRLVFCDHIAEYLMGQDWLTDPDPSRSIIDAAGLIARTASGDNLELLKQIAAKRGMYEDD